MEWSLLERFCENLSQMMGKNCEIVIHDFTNGFEHTIVRIYNSLTGRAVGDAPTNLFFENFDMTTGDIADLPFYFTEMPDGKMYKSSTTFIRENGKVVGAVCVNMDVTSAARGKRELMAFLGEDTAPKKRELFVASLDDLMEYHLREVERRCGKAARDMTKKEKLEALSYLEEKGVLHMAKASVRLCEFFDFSKFTLYSYLDEIRKSEPSAD